MGFHEPYLVNLDLRTIPSLSTDVLVIGGGVAGLTAALAARKEADVLLLTKEKFPESASAYAQGGVAAVMADDDSEALHIEDTLKAGQGICDGDAVQLLVHEGPDRVKDLIGLGTPFDQDPDGEGLAFTMEGAHSRRRILHAHGDATGRAMVESLLTHVRASTSITAMEQHFVVDLLHHEGTCYGAVVLDMTYGRLLRVHAGATIITTGGLGQIYRETTNPAFATGDGYALCFRAGAVMRDMEFVQFHPTTLYLAGAPRFLISESVRGEGAHLINQDGKRFMTDVSPKAELAPRDVVSQAIARELHRSDSTNVYLDLRHLAPDLIDRRFPNIQQLCADFGLDIKEDVIPVRPAVHYMMGGVKTDLEARTTVHRLFAAGEVACAGVHGANRLASNSLLEGLVFGERAGRFALQDLENASGALPPFPTANLKRLPRRRFVPLDLDDVLRSLKSLTWRNLGIFRNSPHLEKAESTIDQWGRYVLNEQFQNHRGFEIQNMLTVARLIAFAACKRTESRGAHQRLDYPEVDPTWQHSIEFSQLAMP